ncbi:hypothetical protein [Sinorhizobium fredii]|uniref:Uncharacterized protein n=1 Tax=Rhizobium fredii TaxID=380 RepID=A0A2L0H597_RHIFR|nr:hypothetical protein [Sinorhizobium fredii]AUX76372.1 hypothetical protein NXT3_CH01804 [Sinorhizobium fredii]
MVGKTSSIAYACDPPNRYCECGTCALPPARNIDLDALKQSNRAYYTAAMFLIFLAAFCGVLAAGLWNANRVQELVAHERNV